MQQGNWIITLLLAGAAFWAGMGGLPQWIGMARSADDLADGFVTPPDAVKAGVWWRWIDGNVSKEGITRDLTEMSRKGIGRVDIFDVLGAPQVGPAPMMGPLWREMFQHALSEAARLRIEVNVVAAAGWGIGGPWVDAAHATKAIEQAEIQVDGPRHIECRLPKPAGHERFYQDVAVIAFREKAHWPLRPATVAANSEAMGYCGERNAPAEDAVDGDPDTFWRTARPCSPAAPAMLDLTYAEPITASGALIAGMPKAGPAEGEILASGDGKTFRSVARFTMGPGERKTIGFPPVTAKCFRLSAARAHAADLQLSEFQVLRPDDEPLLRHGIKWWWFKSAKRSFWDWPQAGPTVLGDEYADADVADCRSAETVDLATRMSEDGTLTWDVPPGRWTVARFGMVLVGESPRAMSRALVGGYEADPYSRQAADLLYDKTAKVLFADAGPQARKAFTGIFTDSYEIGASVQGKQGTWTNGFREEFRRRHGYDLLPYLPALARRVVDGRRATNRFLWDYRQTLSALYNGFFEQLALRAHRDGLRMRAENGYGTYPFPHIDGLAAFGRVDVPMGEFWFNDPIVSQFFGFADSVRTAASAAHIYGKPIAGAETLTVANGLLQSPRAWKAELDGQFCNGLNQAMIHLWSLQYDPAARPGLYTFDAINANMTWWEHSPAFLSYVARCQHLLRQGRFVADACYFFGEESCSFVPARRRLNPVLPEGYDFDGINAEVILNQLTCRDGRASLSSGQSYRYLVLPSRSGWPITEGLMHKLAALVHDGLTIVGAKPGLSPALSMAAKRDAEIRRLADKLWGTDRAKTGARAVGKGRVFWGQSLAAVFAADKVMPDVAFERDADRHPAPSIQATATPTPFIDFIHRATPQSDIYFLANSGEQPAQIRATFRISGRQPELWDPLTGTQRELQQFATHEGRTTVPLELQPCGSMFIVFRKPATAPVEGAVKNFPAGRPVQEIAGPWTVQFDPKWFYPRTGLNAAKAEGTLIFAKLEDWSRRPETAVKYFSGSAVYRNRFTWARETSRRSRLFLDLGTVEETARVRLNGIDVGTVWCSPWRVEITGVIQSGENTLEIEVANAWMNRLAGDALLPVGERRTKTNFLVNAKQPLLPSGLLGPVQVLAIEDAVTPRSSSQALSRGKRAGSSAGDEISSCSPCFSGTLQGTGTSNSKAKAIFSRRGRP